MLKTEPNHLLILVDMTNATVGTAFMKEAKRLATEMEDHFDRQAIVGIDGLKALLLEAYNAVTRKGGLKPHKTRDEALAWLAS